MKFIAILVLLYFMLGFVAALAIIEATEPAPARPDAFRSETPLIQVIAQFVLLAILLGLPVLGYLRARKQGTFLRFSPRVWLILPPSLVVSGFGAGFLAWRFL